MLLQQSVDELQFEFLPQKPVVVESDSQSISSDAGLLPIHQFDQRVEYTRRLAACLVDRRNDPDHSHEQMVVDPGRPGPTDEREVRSRHERGATPRYML